MDPSTKKVNYDRTWHAEKKRASESTESISSSLNRSFPPGMPESEPALSDRLSHVDNENPLFVTDDTPPLDDRFENPALEIDPDIRARFKTISTVLDEREAPVSEFQKRNKGLIPTKAAPSVLKVIIGGKVVKTVEQKVDDRGRYQDRHGNYIGPNLGQMKKHLVEDRAALIKLRDEEMVRATEAKRSWEAMSLSERQEILAKRRVQAEAFRTGPGAAESDIFEYSEMPNEYTCPSSTRGTASRGSSTSGSVTSERKVGPYRNTGSHVGSLSSIPRGGLGSPRSSTQTINASRSFYSGQRGPPGSLTPTTNQESGTSTPSQADTPSAVADPGPELFPIQDVSIPIERLDNDKLAEQYEELRQLTSNRGRVVVVTLHEPAAFSPATVIKNVFAGIIQEIQFFPRERQAIVVFVFSTEAEAFVKHVNTVKQKDAHTFRRLQLDAEWYGGSEDRATYPIQQRVFYNVLVHEARRVIKVNGVKVAKSKKDVAEDMKVSLGVILAKVALVVEKRRFVREEVGNAVIVEFVSIKDAAEAMVKFQKGKVPGYEGCQVSWLSDPCDKANRYGTFAGCWCRHCKD
jgi:hypothetical protein